MTAKRIFGSDTKTTWVGLMGVIVALSALAKCFISGIDWMCLLLGAQGVITAVGVMLSKDYNATGGTVPVTKEAISRVDSPGLTTWMGQVKP